MVEFYHPSILTTKINAKTQKSSLVVTDKVFLRSLKCWKFQQFFFRNYYNLNISNYTSFFFEKGLYKRNPYSFFNVSQSFGSFFFFLHVKPYFIKPRNKILYNKRYFDRDYHITLYNYLQKHTATYNQYFKKTLPNKSKSFDLNNFYKNYLNNFYKNNIINYIHSVNPYLYNNRLDIVALESLSNVKRNYRYFKKKNKNINLKSIFYEKKKKPFFRKNKKYTKKKNYKK